MMQDKLIEKCRYFDDAKTLVEIINTFCARKPLKLCIPTARIKWNKFSVCKPPYTERPRKFLNLIAGLGCSTACLGACASCLTLTPFNLGCAGGTGYKKGDYFGHKSKEITGHRKICQKIPLLANLPEFRLTVMPNM